MDGIPDEIVRLTLTRVEDRTFGVWRGENVKTLCRRSFLQPTAANAHSLQTSSRRLRHRKTMMMMRLLEMT